MSDEKQSKMQEYASKIEYEVIDKDELSAQMIEDLKIKKGLVIETNTTDLYIRRSLATIGVLGSPTIMETADNYVILDSFGFSIWNGDAESIVEYVAGWFDTSDIN